MMLGAFPQRWGGKDIHRRVNRAWLIRRELDEAAVNYAIGAIKGAIKQYFY